MRVAAPVAFIRLTDGSVGQFEEGGLVPDDADPDHVAELLKKDVLVDEGDDGKGGETPDPTPTPPAKKTVAKPGPPAGGSSS